MGTTVARYRGSQASNHIRVSLTAYVIIALFNQSLVSEVENDKNSVDCDHLRYYERK